jgi:hypothetical protein
VAPPADQEIARWREPTEELELFEFERQLSIDGEEEKLEEEDEASEGQEEDEGDWFSGPELLALMQARGTSLHFAPKSASTGLPINITSNGRGQLRQAFANFVSVMRYVWLASEFADRQLTQASVCYAELSEIALRLEPAICSEAPSKRMLGQQRRFLAPHANEARLTFGADSHKRERAGGKGASTKDDLKTKSKSMIAPPRTVMCEEMEK